jgi:lipopolysaccharide export LptBFGC system permease protein LptF
LTRSGRAGTLAAVGTFNRYVLKQLLASGGYWFVALTAIAMSYLLGQIFKDFPSQGLAFILIQTPYLLGVVVPHTLAFATAISATLVMGRLSADRELQAMRTSGIPQTRVLDPISTVALLVAGLATVFSLVVTPAAYRRRIELEREGALAILNNPPPGEQTLRLGKTYVMRYSGTQGATLLDVFIIERDSATRDARAYYVARRATLNVTDPQAPEIILEDCNYWATRPAKEKRPEQTDEGHMDRLPFPIQLDQEAAPDKDLDGMRLWQLYEYAEISQDARRKREAMTQFHGRIAGSLAPFPLLFLAAGIGMRVRRSSRLAGFGAALPSLVLLYGLEKVFTNLSASGALPAHVGPYLGPALILSAAVGVVYVQCRG